MLTQKLRLVREDKESDMKSNFLTQFASFTVKKKESEKAEKSEESIQVIEEMD